MLDRGRLLRHRLLRGVRHERKHGVQPPPVRLGNADGRIVHKRRVLQLARERATAGRARDEPSLGRLCYAPTHPLRF